MKPIEGLEDQLGAIYSEVQAERLVEQRKAIRGQVNGIYTNILGWQAEKKRLDAQSAKLADKITKAQDKLEAIKRGDWSVLQEEKKEGDDKKSSGPSSPDD